MANRLLIVRYGGLGDFVLALPVIYRISREFADHKLCIACYREHYLDVIKEWGIEYDFYFDSMFHRIFYKIEHTYDIIISLMGSRDKDYRDAINRMSNRAIITNGSGLSEHTAWYLYKMVFGSDSTVKFLQDIENINIAQARGDAVVIAMGSGGKKKNLTVDIFLNIANMFVGIFDRIVLLKGAFELKGMASRSYDIAIRYFNIRGIKYDIASANNVKSLINILKMGRVFIGNDSGITHLSSYIVNTNIVLFKDSDPFLFAPLKNTTIVLI